MVELILKKPILSYAGSLDSLAGFWYDERGAEGQCRMAKQGDKTGFSITVLIGSATALGVLFIFGAIGYSIWKAGHEKPDAVLSENTIPKPALLKSDNTKISTIPESPAAQSLQNPLPLPSGKKQAESKAVSPVMDLINGERKEKPQLLLNNLAGTLRVRIADVQSVGDRLPLEHTCYRLNRSPEIKWTGVPDRTKSLVVILERQDNGKPPAWLWILFNVDPQKGFIDPNLPHQADLPDGSRHARNVYNKAEYTGPCEPKGKIPYALRLFALDTKPDVASGIGSDDLVRAMNGHIIDATQFDIVHYLKF